MNVSALRSKDEASVANSVVCPPPGGVKEALVRELQWLRRGEGLTLRKLGSAPTLLCLGSGLERFGNRGSDEVIFAVDRMLRLELANLGDGLGARALRAALAVDREDPKTLTRRRHDFAEEHHKHPDTVESHENRAINELALKIIARAKPDFRGASDGSSATGDGGGTSHTGAKLGAPHRTLPSNLSVLTPAGRAGTASLVRGYRELLDSLLEVVQSAEECLVATGSRSRDREYLQRIEDRLASTSVVHYRVLCGPPHWSVLKSHLLRLQAMRTESTAGGNPRILIGLLSDVRRQPEWFICANERRAVLVLPSLSGSEHFDTGLELDGEEYGMAYVRLVQEMYAASQPIETESGILALPLERE